LFYLALDNAAFSKQILQAQALRPAAHANVLSGRMNRRAGGAAIQF
jgi:hypothetical protein